MISHPYGELLEAVCAFLNEMPDRACAFLPETFERTLPQASVALLSTGAEKHPYVDGSCRAEIPLEIRLRVAAQTPRARLDAVRFMDRTLSYLTATPLLLPLPSGRITGTRPLSGCEKSAVMEDGSEEYRISVGVGIVLGHVEG